MAKGPSPDDQLHCFAAGVAHMLDGQYNVTEPRRRP